MTNTPAGFTPPPSPTTPPPAPPSPKSRAKWWVGGALAIVLFGCMVSVIGGAGRDTDDTGTTSPTDRAEMTGKPAEEDNEDEPASAPASGRSAATSSPALT